jgi:hypothetical protein
MSTGPFDETFLELTMEDIQENIVAIAKSRAKRPQPRETVIQAFGPQGYQRISIVVSRVQP